MSYRLALAFAALLLGGASVSRAVATHRTFGPSAPTTTTLGQAPYRGDHPRGDDTAGHDKEREPDRGVKPNEHDDADESKDDCKGCTDYEKQALAINREMLGTTRRYVCWTAVLVVIAFLVGAGQVWLLRGTLEATETAANAATTSAKAAKASVEHLERPWIIVDVVELVGWPETPPQKWEFPLAMTLEWSTVNHGRSPAWLTYGSISVGVRDAPLDPKPPSERGEVVYEMVFPPDKVHGGKLGFLLTQDEYGRIMRRDACLVFWSFNTYRDTFGTTHTTRTAATWKMEQGMAMGWGGSYSHWGPAWRFVYAAGDPATWCEYT